MPPDVVFPYNFDSRCNCSYTSGTTGVQAKVSIAALMKLMKDIPETPRILTMEIKLIPSSVLSGNTIILSKDVADALEEALNKE